MNKKWIILIIVAIAIFWIYSSVTGRYNGMVRLEQEVKTEWANVETQYQRRFDLIPNLVNTVKGFAEQEKEVLIGVTEARAKATSVTVDAGNITADKLQQFQAAQGQVSSSLSRLLVTVEKYPELKSNQNFLELQAQLEGTENRIQVSRTRFNEAAKNFNIYISSFPQILFAKTFGFEEKPQFSSDQGAEKAPTVQF